MKLGVRGPEPRGQGHLSSGGEVFRREGYGVRGQGHVRVSVTCGDEVLEAQGPLGPVKCDALAHTYSKTVENGSSRKKTI